VKGRLRERERERETGAEQCAVCGEVQDTVKIPRDAQSGDR